MSLIGPRAWIPDYCQYFNDEQKRRLEVKPGITGLAAVNGRNGITIQEKIKYDIEYVEKLSFLLDLKIMFKTIKVIICGKDVDITKQGIKDEIDSLKRQNEQVEEKV